MLKLYSMVLTAALVGLSGPLSDRATADDLLCEDVFISDDLNHNVVVPAGARCRVSGVVNGNFDVRGTLLLKGAHIKGNIFLTGGTLIGTGTIEGNVKCDGDRGGRVDFIGSLKGNNEC